jgi:transposase-like protein
MGNRYFLTIKCPSCGYFDEDVYYAPTCGFVDWRCPKCGKVVDLEEETGISYEDASNLGVIEKLCSKFENKNKKKLGM